MRFIILLILLMTGCATSHTKNDFQIKAENNARAASIKSLQNTDKNELRMWISVWSTNGVVLTEKSVSVYAEDNNEDEKLRLVSRKPLQTAPDIFSEIEPLAQLNGKILECDAEINDWPVRIIEGVVNGKHFSFLALQPDFCKSETFDLVNKTIETMNALAKDRR